MSALRKTASRLKGRTKLAVFEPAATSNVVLPFYSCTVSAGFPSPADDHLQNKLDLNTHVVKHPAATFFVRVQGDSMRDANVHEGDILVVDKSEHAAHNKIVVAVLNGEYVCKRLYKRNGVMRLLPANPAFQPIEITEGMDFEVWGVVTHILHQAR
jgi:DNA polymerase V